MTLGTFINLVSSFLLLALSLAMLSYLTSILRLAVRPMVSIGSTLQSSVSNRRYRWSRFRIIESFNST